MSSDRLRISIEAIGISAVVFSLWFVVAEMNQTQAALEAQSMSERNQRLLGINQMQLDFEMGSLREKIANEELLTNEENLKLRNFGQALLRHFEVLHFEESLGLVDQEVWEANLRGIRGLRNADWFNYAYPNWGIDSSGGNTFRASFIELTNSLVDQ